jgi:hypothetical protein
MMEAVRTSETSVENYFTWQYIPEDNSEELPYLFTYISSYMIQQIALAKLEREHCCPSSEKALVWKNSHRVTFLGQIQKTNQSHI